MRVVLANGCFDPLHYGHLLHLEAARAMGDELVVALTSDETVRREKGARRPVFHQDQRAAMLKALRCVDRVVIVDALMDGLLSVRPQVLVKGSDYSGGPEGRHMDHCRKHGIEVRITDTPKWSATEVGNELRRG